jgi:hypothetical protein
MKKTILFLFIILYPAIMLGQMKYVDVPTDTVLAWFQQNKQDKPLHVLLYKWRNKSNIRYNYKEMYYNDSLKYYLMQCLDVEAFKEYEIQSQKEKIESNTKFVDGLILNKLKNNQAALDSVISDADLYKIYKDSVITKNINNYIPQVEETVKYPHLLPIDILTNIGYPEFYEKLKQYWIESNNPYYYAKLLYLGDPDVCEIFDNEVKEFVRTNGKTGAYDMFFKLVWDNTICNTSYGIQKQLETLSVTSKLSLLNDTPVPFNCLILPFLVGWIEHYKIPVDFPLTYTDSTYLYIPKIKKAAKLIQQKFDEEQAYWRDNMPFNKNK